MSRCNSSFADVQLSLEKNSRFSLIRGFFLKYSTDTGAHVWMQTGKNKTFCIHCA